MRVNDVSDMPSDPPEVPPNNKLTGSDVALLVTAIVAAVMVVVAVMSESPGIVILAVIIIAPILVHSTVARKRPGVPAAPNKHDIGTASFFAVIFITALAAGAFFVTCFGVTVIGMALDQAHWERMIYLGLVAGIMVGIPVLVRLIRWLRRKK